MLPREIAVIHVDITDRRLAEMDAIARKREHADALKRLQMMAGQIRDSIELEHPVRDRKRSALVHLTKLAQEQEQPQATLLRHLSNRELQVLDGLVYGETNSAMASRLQLSRKSISTYRSRILEKLKLGSNAQLVTFAASAKIL